MPKLPTQAVATVIAQPRPLAARITALGQLLGLIQAPPPQWRTAQARPLNGHPILTGGNSSDAPKTLAPKTCESYKELVESWKKALEWHEGLDSALSIMLASSMSTQFVGEQLWLKIIGPPSCGKTSLMEGLAVAREWYFSRDTIRGFHSGARAEDEKDLPLADLVNGKTLGTKDGDTLLKAPNLTQILAEGRALYDRVSRTNYRNFVNREYLGHRMTWHLAGTNSLREIDDSELGARFLDVVVMDHISEAFERRVGMRAAMQEANNMLRISDGKPESQYPEELAEAMSLTGGYLDFLRTNALEISKSIRATERPMTRCNDFGIFTAFMRARPSGEEAGREFSARLIKQYTRMAIALAAVLGKNSLDDEVLARTHKSMMDTSRGQTLDLVRFLGPRPQGIELRALMAHMHLGDDKLRKQLTFLRRIGVVETDVNHKRWRVIPSVQRLYEELKNA
jgi:hypothetical protein